MPPVKLKLGIPRLSDSDDERGSQCIVALIMIESVVSEFTGTLIESQDLNFKLRTGGGPGYMLGNLPEVFIKTEIRTSV